MIPISISNSISPLETISVANVREFKELGVTVIANVLTRDEISSVRRGFSEYLHVRGCDVNNLFETASSLSSLSSTNGSGGVLDIFYEDWKLRLNEHPKVVSAMCDLWKETYACRAPNFNHPYCDFDPTQALMYIDRVCYRLPDDISVKFGRSKKMTLQRSLTPHLDCCPHNMHADNKWRPIQCFIALSDTHNKDEGGFEACLGHHLNFDRWALERKGTMKTNSDGTIDVIPPPCVGQFTPIRMVEDRDIIDNFRHIPCSAGDMVCWDYRIPHANARHNLTTRSREAVYIGLLPRIPLNERYVALQLERMKLGLVPDDQWHNHSIAQSCSYNFSRLGQKMLGINLDGEDQL